MLYITNSYYMYSYKYFFNFVIFFIFYFTTWNNFQLPKWNYISNIAVTLSWYDLSSPSKIVGCGWACSMFINGLAKL